MIIPTRNRWTFLERTLRCVLRQEDVQLELIVVDDGSEDETPQRLAAIEDPRVRVIRNDRGTGVARARNRGMAEARGAWVAWLDDDDVWAPRKLRSQLDAAGDDYDFVWADAVVIDAAGRLVGFEQAPDGAEFAAGVVSRNPMPGGCSNAIARAEAVSATGGFDESLHIVADWDYWIRLLAHTRPTAVHAPLVAYTVHTGNMVLRDPGDARDEFARFQAKHSSVHGAPDYVAYCDWLAVGLRRGGRRGDAARLLLEAGFKERSLKGLGLSMRVLLGDWAVELPRRRWRPTVPQRPAWLNDVL